MQSKLDVNIINTHDLKTLGIVDTSVYNPKLKIEQATIEITPPGYTTVATPHFEPKSLNIFNSNTTGITNVTCETDLVGLPDGLWRIRYSICPNDKLYIDKYFLRTAQFECKFTQAFLNLDFNNIESNLKKKKELENIDFFITGAIAAANTQNTKLSNDLYQKAVSLLANAIDGDCGC